MLAQPSKWAAQEKAARTVPWWMVRWTEGAAEPWLFPRLLRTSSAIAGRTKEPLAPPGLLRWELALLPSSLT